MTLDAESDKRYGDLLEDLQNVAFSLGLSPNCGTIACNSIYYNDDFRNKTKEELAQIPLAEWLRVPNVGAKTRKVIWTYLHPEDNESPVHTFKMALKCPRCNHELRGEFEAGGLRLFGGRISHD